MSRFQTNAAVVERAIATARALQIPGIGENGLSPHLVIDEMIGLAAYRDFMECPDTETLAAYAEEGRTLPLKRALLIANHEKRCPLCATDIADMRLTLRNQVVQALDNLPEWTTRLVGQEDLRDRLSEQMLTGDSQVVTLTAPSGMGKTRLMLETALEQSYLFADGIWLLPNSGADDTDGIAASLGDMMQLGLSARQSAFDQLCEHLTGKRALIAIDGIDSRRAGVHAALSRLNTCAPELVCLTTGQSPIGLDGERPLTVTPLNYLPLNNLLSGMALNSNVPTDTLISLESMQMFTACAEQIVPDWSQVLRDETAVRATGAVCTYTAGNPLAIELAAARLQSMSPVDIQQSLTTHSPALFHTPNAPDTLFPDSLHSLLLWSVSLLSTREARLLQGLANFRERFTPEQARAVAAEEEAETLLETLRAHSLLQRWRTGGDTFYRLPNPVAQFINSGLPHETSATVSRRFVAYFGLLAQDLASQMEDRRQLEAMREIETNLAHFRVAMDTAATTGQLRTVGQIGLSMHRFLSLRGHWQECQERLRMARDAFAKNEADALTHQAELTLARCLISQGQYSEASNLLHTLRDLFTHKHAPEGVAETERALAGLAQFQGHFHVAVPYLEKSLQYYRSVDNSLRAAECRYNLGWLALQNGDHDRAERYLTASVSTFRDLGERFRLGTALATLGNLAIEQKRLAQARDYFEESLNLREELGDIRGIASTTANLGRIWATEGDPARAEYCFSRARRNLERLNDRRTLALVHIELGELAHSQNEETSARFHFTTALDLFTELDNTQGIGGALLALGRVAHRSNRYQEARQYLYKSLFAFQSIGDTTGQAESLFRLAELIRAQDDPVTACLLTCVAQQHLDGQSEQLSTQSELHIEIIRFRSHCEASLSVNQLRNVAEQLKSTSLEEVVRSLLADFIPGSDTTNQDLI